MRPTGYWRPAGLQDPLIGSYLRAADETTTTPPQRAIHLLQCLNERAVIALTECFAYADTPLFCFSYSCEVVEMSECSQSVSLMQTLLFPSFLILIS